jgi:hypothetical protein
MKKPKELQLSDMTEKYVRKAITHCIQDLKTQMEIASLDHMKVSLDLDFGSAGKFAGVKISAFKFETLEKIYDEDVANDTL